MMNNNFEIAESMNTSVNPPFTDPTLDSVPSDAPAAPSAATATPSAALVAPSAATLAALGAERDQALARSGWGQRFHLLQPRNLAFWVFGLLGILGAALFVMIIQPSGDNGIVLLRSIAAAVTLYALALWWFLRAVDKYARLSRGLIVAAFCWGAFPAFLISALGNDPLLTLWNNLFGTAFGVDWGAALTAPLVEEWSKGLGLIILITMAARQIATALDGFVLGAFIGLGFQVFEDVLYGVQSAGAGFGLDPFGMATHVLVLRFITGISGHVVFSAIFCAGLVYVLGRPAQARRRGFGAALILLAMAMHGFWDALGGIFGPIMNSYAQSFTVTLPVITIFIGTAVWVYQEAAPTERAIVRDVLAPDAAVGVLSQEQLAAATTGSLGRRAYVRAGTCRADRRSRRYSVEAVDDLANELASSGGADSDRVLFARNEVGRLGAVPQLTH